MSEDKVSRWLHETTPEPPTAYQFDRAAEPERSGTMVPVIAAACVALLVALVVVLLHVGGGGTKHAAQPAASTHRDSSVASTATSATPTAPADRPWGLRPLPTQSLLPGSLVTDGTHLFGLQKVGTRTAVVRITADGRVAARLQFTSIGPVGQLVTAAGQVWLVTYGDGNAPQLTGLSASGLAVRSQIALPGGGPIAADGDTIYVASGATVYRVDAVGRRIVAHLTVGHDPISTLAAGGGRIYLGTTGPADSRRLMVARQGAVQASVASQTVRVLTATTDGVWVAEDNGSRGVVIIRTTSRLKAVNYLPAFFETAPTIGVQDDVTWIGGPGTLACADSATGRLRGSAAVRGADITGATRVGTLVFATSQGTGPTARLVTLDPPAACG